MSMVVKKVILVEPRGFCAGVARAIDVVEQCLDIFGEPVYVKHEIVHNKHVVQRLHDKGAQTVEHPDEAPLGAVIVFSAHGSPPEHYIAAQKRNQKIIDATCPLVTKVHQEVKRYTQRGYKIIYVGHHGHVEGIGVRRESSEEDIPLVENPDDVDSLQIGHPEKLIYLTQTTMSVDETKDIILALKKKYPQIEEPPKEDICYATTNRQTAIKKLAEHVELILVVGSQTSSNSKRLVETAKASGVKSHLIDDSSMIKVEWLKNIEIVGVSAGASAPDHCINEVVDFFMNKGAELETLTVMDEKVQFLEPRELVQIKKQKWN